MTLYPLSLRLTTPDSRLTWAGFVRLMATCEIRQGSSSWRDYERAKQVVADLTQDSQEYQQFITWAAQFIGV